GRGMTRIASLRDRFTDVLPPGSLRARLAKGVFWTFSGAVAVQAFNVVSSMLVARIMGKEIFGEFGIIRSTAGVFYAGAGLGLGLTANKYMAEFREKDPQRAGRILGLSTMVALVSGAVVALLAFTFAHPLAEYVLKKAELGRYVRISAIVLLMGAVGGMQNG